ncbi:MAG: hypothetical protein M3Z21_14475 [Pseudomonadota bacterium]|nr:hypothetical protein [Pseudomonadota bacterium]
MKRFAALLFIPWSAVTAGGVALEEVPWPDSQQCQQCLTLQFSHLEMQWPYAELGKVTILRGNDAAMDIRLRRDGKVVPPEESLVFLVQMPDKLTERFRRAGFFAELGVNDNEDFFDFIGDPARESDAIQIMRQVMDLNMARRYTKASRGNLHAYWIQTEKSIPDYLYFVINGQEEVYKISGSTIDERLYTTMLSNLHYAAP